jgi:hypothetical protein
MQERRGRSRLPLKLILFAILTTSALWLAELYMAPTWDKIRSLLLGYFLGSFIMEWVRQRADRALLEEATPPREPPLAAPR